MDPYAKFNKAASEFLTKMAGEFPNETKIRQYKLAFDQVKLYDSKKPVILFMSSLEEYGQEIMTKNENFFKDTSRVNAAESMSNSLGLVEIWDSIHKDTKESIWAYMQQLYVIGMKAMGKDAELLRMYNSIKK